MVPSTKPEVLMGNEWLKAEFEQSYEHLRDRDERILDIIKFYSTLVCSVGTACVALLALRGINHPYAFVGGVLLVTSVIGALLMVWLIAFRRYFVTSARQLNAVRQALSADLPEGMREAVLIHDAGGDSPPYWHWGSAHTSAIFIVALLNATMAGLGATAIAADLGFARWAAITLPAGIIVVHILFAVGFCRKTLGEE